MPRKVSALMCCVALRGGLHFTSPQFAHVQSGNHNIQSVQLVRRLEVITVVSHTFSRALETFAAPFSCESKKPRAVSILPVLQCSQQAALEMVLLPCSLNFAWDWTGSYSLHGTSLKQGLQTRQCLEGGLWAWQTFYSSARLLHSVPYFLYIYYEHAFA